jgi:hypothetical protein
VCRTCCFHGFLPTETPPLAEEGGSVQPRQDVEREERKEKRGEKRREKRGEKRTEEKGQIEERREEK